MDDKQIYKRLIDGKHAKSRNIIAMCHVLTHRGYLTKRLIESHDCISKKCPFFEKLKPEYWETLEREAKQKEYNRMNRKQASEKKTNRDLFIRETLEKSGNIYVTSIKEQNRNLIVITYIYDRKTDLSPEIQILRQKLKKTIKLQARIGSDEAIEKLIRKPRCGT